jgi:peptidoglycan glycosyltransferase
VADFALTAAPALPLPVAPADSSVITEPERAAIGQEALTVTPLQMGLALAALGNEGTVPPPQLVWRVQGWDGAWHPVTPAVAADEDRMAASPGTAQRIRRALPQADGVREHVATALSGPGVDTNVWYLGLAPASNPRYVVVALVEDRGETAVVAAIGRRLLQSVIGAR